MADDNLAEMHALAERAAGAAYDRWHGRPNRNAYVSDLARRAARAAVDTVAPLLIEQGRRQAFDAMHAEFIGDDCAEWTHVDQINDFINEQRTGHRG